MRSSSRCPAAPAERDPSSPAAAAAGAAFAEFARSHDPGAFAVAFDATVQDLLLVAVRLGERGAGAEDLLQQTWLRAIARARRYDPSRPLLPWLVTILVREARRAHRGRTRRERHERACAEAHAPHVARDLDTPLHAAQRAELEADAMAAIERLDPVHRDVLILRLVHGLTSPQIARALSRSPETVRSQLARGLQKLRRILPRGHAAEALLLVDLAARGDVVRAALLAHVRALPPMTTATATSWAVVSRLACVIPGAIVMKKLVVTMLALAAVAAALTIAFHVAAPATNASSADVASSAMRVAAGRDSTAPAAHETDATPPREDLTPNVAAAAPTATLHGRCVDESGQPLAGVTVKLVREQEGDVNALAEARLRSPVDAWQQPEPVTTADDGRFTFTFAPPVGRRLEAIATKLGRMRAFRWSKWIEPGTTVDFGALTMAPGCLLHGRITDRTGMPITGLRVCLDPWPGTSQNPTHESWSQSADSDRTGAYELEVPLPPARYRITSTPAVMPNEVTLGSGIEQTLDLVADCSGVVATIEGVLVDRSGRPLPDYGVAAGDGRLGWWVATDEDGHFVLSRRADDPSDPVRLSARREYDFVTYPAPVPWDTRDVRFVVDTGVALDLVVVDGETGEGVRRYGVRLVPVDTPGVGYDSSRRLRGVGNHDGGRLRLTDIPAGRYMMSVEAANERYSPTAYEPLTIGDADVGPLRIALWPPAEVDVTVVTGQGKPKAGSSIEVMQVCGGKEGAPPAITHPFEMPVFIDGAVRFGNLVGKATTDADGHARLVVPRGGPYAVRIRGDHETSYHEGCMVTADQAAWRFVVDGAAAVVVQLQPWPLPLAPDLHLGLAEPTVQLDDGREFTALVPNAPPDEHGRLFVGGIASGSGKLRAKVTSSIGDAQTKWVDSLAIPLAPLTPGEHRVVPVDLTRWLPVKWSMRVLVNGAPPVGARVVLLSGADDGLVESRTMGEDVDENGRVQFALPDTTVRPLLALRGGKLPHVLGTFATAAAGPEPVVDLAAAKPVLRVLGADGVTPLAGIRLLDRDGSWAFPDPTRQDGTIGPTPIVCGPIELWTWPKDLADPNARTALVNQGGGLTSRLVPLRATLTPGQRTLDLVAPASSGY